MLDNRDRVYDAAIAANGGQWPDMEGLIRDIYVAFLGPGDLALDVGVNHGGHLIQMAEAVGQHGKVIGFEAVPELIRRTRETIDAHYRHVESRIVLHNVAVSDYSGSTSFFFSQMNDSGLSGMARRAVIEEGPVEELRVPVETIDKLLEGEDLSKLTFAKFDIEGAEFAALRGASRALEKCPLLTFEWDQTAPVYFNYDPPALYEWLRGRGYRIYDPFSFSYENGDEFVAARVWNFVAIADALDPAEVLRPAQTTLHQLYPSVFELPLDG
jgi:FkbM family methyltransferase